MADTIVSDTTPTLPESVHEVHGVFPSDAALQRAIADLTLQGFDRAALSLPDPLATGDSATPDHGAANPNTDTDTQQMRTLHASMAGSVGALAAAGVVIATGGAAAVGLAAAAAVGAGTGLLAHSAARASDDLQHEERSDAAHAGRLVLSVRTTSAAQQEKATNIMREAGATDAAPVERVDHAISSQGWTGL